MRVARIYAVDPRRQIRLEYFSFLVEVIFEMVGRLEERFVLVSFACLLAHFGWDVLEEDLLEDVVEGDRAEELIDSCGELVGSATVSRHSLEKQFDSVAFAEAVGLDEVLLEGLPVVRGLIWLLEELVNFCIGVNSKLGFDEGEFVFC